MTGKLEEAEFGRDQEYGIGQAEHKVAIMPQAGVSGNQMDTRA